jgi:hypothetical protein
MRRFYSDEDVARWTKANDNVIAGLGASLVIAVLVPFRPGQPGATHLLSELLGGPRNLRSNLVVTCNGVNRAMYDAVESLVIDWIGIGMAGTGLPVDYEVEVEYAGTSPYPARIKMRAIALDPSSLSAAQPWCREIDRWTRPIQGQTDVRNCPGV